jgi:hypothetical protein
LMLHLSWGTTPLELAQRDRCDQLPRPHHDADVRIRFDAEDCEENAGSDVFLPEDMPWPTRWAAIDRAVRGSWARASVIILTHDNLAFSRMCLSSVSKTRSTRTTS